MKQINKLLHKIKAKWVCVPYRRDRSI